MKKFKNLNIEWVPREENAMADRLSKEGIKKKGEVEEVVSVSEKEEKIEMTVFNLGDSIFKVVSGSGNCYAVDFDRKVYSCPQNQLKKKECKHLKYIKNTHKM